MEHFYCWLAGFFEGEGCFYLNEKQAKASISITQAIYPKRQTKEILEQIKSIFGGCISPRKIYTINRKQVYIWTITESSAVIKFFDNIFPYMKLRKEEIQDKLTKYKQLREERKRYIPDLYELTYKELKQKYGVCSNTISRMRKYNLPYCQKAPHYKK